MEKAKIPTKSEQRKIKLRQARHKLGNSFPRPRWVWTRVAHFLKTGHSYDKDNTKMWCDAADEFLKNKQK